MSALCRMWGLIFLSSAPGVGSLVVPSGRDLGIQDTEQILGLGGLLFPRCIQADLINT